MSTIPQPRYRTLYRLGPYCWLDAEWKIQPDFPRKPPLINHYVSFRIINVSGERLNVGSFFITGKPNGLDVFDEDGQEFPSLEAAIENYVCRLTKLAPMPDPWADTPAEHEIWNGPVTAFDAPAPAELPPGAH